MRLQCVQVDLDDLSREKIVTFTVVRTGRYRYSKGNQGCGKTLHKVIFYKVFKAKLNANPQAYVKTQKTNKKTTLISFVLQCLLNVDPRSTAMDLRS